MKKLYIAEKPSVAQEFAKALKIRAARKDGYLEGEEAVVTWCVGHLVTMSYPEAYDEKYKRWSLATLPFLPKEFKYEVIPGVETGSDSFGEFPNHYHTISPVVRRSTVVGQTSATSRFLSKVMPGCILIVRIVGNKAYTNGLIV